VPQHATDHTVVSERPSTDRQVHEVLRKYPARCGKLVLTEERQHTTECISLTLGHTMTRVEVEKNLGLRIAVVQPGKHLK
jgi:hypothetical protein